MYADKNEIEWLLFESGISVKEIYTESGVARTTVIDLVNKTSSIDKMRFDNASKLTLLAKTRKESIGNK
ncbi:hypothetical protein [Enterococcus faecium]|uniref:hypothetical protein n=1 Tax=Enterococcus faecium TaxID=1352 RepID=UPI0011E688A3|nr:hypothetical protein [Enterococcus faecium]EMF0083411.1 hypothetical protein [Enterococcus hirae]EMF0215541.1 hypothetical protein [Enterococcus hirae]EMF0435724.1 hypothetical protein [Enterococcus hirae]EMF0437363.1 hypothetical protein [Enterococcus hirae]TYR09486.1 hypothetical protein BEK95_11495 [Enterococcus faecium]